MIRGLVRTILRLVLLVMAIPIFALAYGFLTTGRQAPPAIVVVSPEQRAVHDRLVADVPGYKRPEESTYLTYPEWSIVYAARDYAAFVQDRNPADFPYLAYVGGFWQDYAAMIRASSHHPFNAQNHLMLVVIGVSHTVEHLIQLVYENTVGRLTALAAYPVEEDRDLAAIAGEYAAFLDQTPWYRFPYAERRAELWSIPAAEGTAAIRSWERKLGFGLALTIKQAYAGLISGGLSATQDPAALDINVWATGPVAEAIAGEPDTTIVSDLGADGTVFRTRRYQVFTEMIPRLIERGMSFVEIGGNDEIMVTLLSNEEIGLPDGVRLLFAGTSPIDPSQIRTGLAIPVPILHEILPDLANGGARLEHVYDY